MVNELVLTTASYSSLNSEVSALQIQLAQTSAERDVCKTGLKSFEAISISLQEKVQELSEMKFELEEKFRVSKEKNENYFLEITNKENQIQKLQKVI